MIGPFIKDRIECNMQDCQLVANQFHMFDFPKQLFDQFLQHTSLHVARVLAWYSASMLDTAITPCFLLFQILCCKAMNTWYLKVEHISEGEPTRSRFMQPTICVLCLHITRMICNCFDIPKDAHLSICQWLSQVDYKNCLTILVVLKDSVCLQVSNIFQSRPETPTNLTEVWRQDS